MPRRSSIPFAPSAALAAIRLAAALLLAALLAAPRAAPLAAQAAQQAGQQAALHAMEPPAVLESVAALPVSLRTENGVWRVGPPARDFYAAFGVGSDAEVRAEDASGVALIAIRALAERIDALERENASLRTTAAGLQNDLAALRAQFERLDGERR